MILDPADMLAALSMERMALDDHADLVIAAFDAGLATSDDVAIACARAEGAALVYIGAAERLMSQLMERSEPIPRREDPSSGGTSDQQESLDPG